MHSNQDLGVRGVFSDFLLCPLWKSFFTSDKFGGGWGHMVVLQDPVATLLSSFHGAHLRHLYGLTSEPCTWSSPHWAQIKNISAHQSKIEDQKVRLGQAPRHGTHQTRCLRHAKKSHLLVDWYNTISCHSPPHRCYNTIIEGLKPSLAAICYWKPSLTTVCLPRLDSTLQMPMAF